MIHFVFYKTNDVFRAEELLNAKNIAVEIVPTPVQDKAYCGVCIRIENSMVDAAIDVLYGMEYKQV